MNALGIVLVWMSLQVTLFGLAGAAVYIVARRLHPASGAAVLSGVLLLTVGIAALSISPWPRWLTLADGRVAAGWLPTAARASTAALEQPASTPEPTTGTASETRQRVGDSAAAPGVFSFLVGCWAKVHNRLADPSHSPPGATPSRWPAWLAAVCLSGMAIGLARVLLGLLALAKLLDGARRVTEPSMLSVLEQLRTQLGCRRPIELRETTAGRPGGSPAVVGWRRPVIILPAEWRCWSADARRSILAHEIAHVAHGHFLMWLTAQAGVVVHFHNPLVHWLAGRLRLEQELAADALGAALSGGAKTYSILLARMALRQDALRTSWAGCPFFPSRGTLMRRIEMLQKQPYFSERAPSRAWSAVLVAALAILALGVSGLRGPTGAAQADEPAAQQASAETKNAGASEAMLPAFERSYLPADVIAVMSIKPLRVAKSTFVVEPTLLSFPMAFGFGIAPTDSDKAPEWDKLREWEVEEVQIITFSVPANQDAAAKSSDSKEPAIIGIYRMRRPYDRGKLRVKLFGEAPDGATEATCHGHGCLHAISDASGEQINYLLVDDRTIVIMRECDVPRVLAADAQSHPTWYDQWQKVADRPIAVGFDTSAAEADAFGQREKGQPEDLFWTAIKQTSQFCGSIASTPDGLKMNATAVCKSPEQATATVQAVKGLLTMAGLAASQLTAPSVLPKEYEALDVGGSLNQMLASVKLDVHDAQISAEAKFDPDFASRFAQATRAVLARQNEEFSAREKEWDQAHQSKLARLAEAFDAYYAAHGHYPPAAVAGPDGKTLHSWRVELLPYLGEQKLFDSYRLDEPWDSEHNKPLVKQIPSVYSTSIWTQKGDAEYFVITGKGMLLDADGPRTRESMTDAPGETLLVLQSQQRVPWTKPVDIEVSADHGPLRPFRGHGKGFYAAFADGTVKFVPKTTDAASIRAMFTKAGGDEVRLR